ncbi:MAG: thioredoxin [Rectinema subterraneum]|uniref:thioredoxin n=1 Tax=Rectinema subterraneum TaxID=2653714 RepID=UPI003C7C430B
MTLDTTLKHVVTEKELKELISSNQNVMVCCGRMGPMCIPVYEAMDELEHSSAYSHIVFRDMAFDSPESAYIRKLPECASFRGLPFTVYWKNGKVVKATSSIQTKEQIQNILDTYFAK